MISGIPLPMTEYLLDTMVASRIMRAHRVTLNGMRRSGATSLGISAITKSEMLFGALRSNAPTSLLADTRLFFRRVEIFDWDEDVAEYHAQIKVNATTGGKSAGTADMMIAAHALALGRTLVTSDQAIHALAIPGLAIADWSR
jgi:tRNA(fMet)-specific endonuclease VapC